MPAADLSIRSVVIGKEFAWCHMQKTGGDATLLFFRLLPRLITHSDPRNVQEKHAAFAERESEVEGKLLACNIRRLPAWSLSWAQQQAQRGFQDDGNPVPMNSPQRMAETPRGDRRLAHFTDNGRFRIDRWLRAEHLAEDFVAFASQLTELTDGDRDSIAEHPLVNELEYDHEIGHWFTPAQVRLMYANNPVWSAVEERVYGNLAFLD
jgi:hypothetical protein